MCPFDEGSGLAKSFEEKRYTKKLKSIWVKQKKQKMIQHRDSSTESKK